MPMSLDLYRAAAPHLWRLWDEIRAEFIDVEARVQAMNERHADPLNHQADRMAHLASLLHPTLDSLRSNLRAYLFEYVVGCEKQGSEHCWRITYDQANGHDRASLQKQFTGLRCPTCDEPLLVRELGYPAGWRDAVGEYYPRSALLFWPEGTVRPLVPGPALH